MTEQNQASHDVLTTAGAQEGRLTKIGAAYPTPKGAGFRFKLKKALAEGDTIVLLPRRARPDQDADEE